MNRHRSASRTRAGRLLLVGLGVLLGPAVLGGSDLFIGADADLKGIGLTFPMYRSFEQRLLPSAAATTYENVDTGELSDAFNPRALWLQDQLEARFEGKRGRVEVAMLRHDPPGKLPLLADKHVFVEHYYRFVKPHEGPWQLSQIRRWVEYYAERSIKQARTKVPGLSCPYPYLAVEFETEPGENLIGVVVKLPEWRKGQYAFFLFAFTYEPRELTDTVGAVLAHLKVTQPQPKVSGPSPKLQNAPPGHQAATAEAEREAARQRVLHRLSNLSGWWLVETPDYFIVSNLEKGNRRLVENIQRDIELYRRLYEALIPPVQPIEEVSVVRVFAEADQYRQFVPENLRWSVGVWMPDQKELVVSPMDHARREDRDRDMLATVYHEAFHQYIHYAMQQRPLPVWFEEGHACLFEAIEVNRREGQIRLLEHKVWSRVLDELIRGDRDDLSGLIALPHDAYYGEGRTERYALAWGLAYYFRVGAKVAGRQHHAAIADAIINQAREHRLSEEQWAAFVREQYDWRDVHHGFRQFWTNARLRRQAEHARLRIRRR